MNALQVRYFSAGALLSTAQNNGSYKCKTGIRNRQHGFPKLTLLTIWPSIGRMHLKNVTTPSDRAQGPGNVLWKIKEQNKKDIIMSSMLLGEEIHCSKTFKAFFSCFTQPAFYIKEPGGQSPHTHAHTHTKALKSCLKSFTISTKRLPAALWEGKQCF